MQKAVLSTLEARGWEIIHPRGSLLEFGVHYKLVPCSQRMGEGTIPWVTIPQLSHFSVAQGRGGECVESGEEYSLCSFVILHDGFVDVSVFQGGLVLDDATFIVMLETLPLLPWKHPEGVEL